MKPIFSRLAPAVTALGLVVLAGCTVRPLLATGAIQPDASGGQSVAAALSSVEVEQVQMALGTDEAVSRVAQRVRNDLVFLLYGGASHSADPRYTLKFAITVRSTAAASIQDADEQQPTSEVLTLTARYDLLDRKTGKTIARGTRQIASPYDVSQQEYAVYRAEIDAQNRAARELAEVLRLTIGQELSRLPTNG